MENKDHTCGSCGSDNMDSNCGHCGGSCLMGTTGRHHNLARMLLSLAVLFFVFWVGLALGELKGYLRDTRYNNDSNRYYGRMMGPTSSNAYPNPSYTGQQ